MKIIGKALLLAVFLIHICLPSVANGFTESASLHIQNFQDDTHARDRDWGGVWSNEPYTENDVGEEYHYFGWSLYTGEYLDSYWKWALSIPVGSRITDAHVEIKCKWNGNLTQNPMVAGFGALIPDGKWETALAFDISNYPDKGALRDIPLQGTEVIWDITENWTAGNWYQSPNIAGLVQTRIDNIDYDPGDPEGGNFGLTLYHVDKHVHRVGTQSKGILTVQWVPPSTDIDSDELEAVPPEIDDFTDDKRHTKEPVDIITGNMTTFPQVDFSLSGNNGPLEFYRTYNSRSAYTGPFGYGWTHSYNLILTAEDYDIYLQLIDAKGNHHYYSDQNLDGIYDSISSDGTSIEKTAGTPDTFIWKTKDGKKYHFNAIHETVCIDPPACTKNDDIYHVTAIEYNDGSQIGFTYSTNPLTGNYTLTQIVDIHEKAINLTYDENDHIVTIDEPGRHADGQLIEYAYANGNLTSVTYPVDAGDDYIRNYYYNDSDSHNLTDIEDERENFFHYRYDSQDRCYLSYGDDVGGWPYFKAELEYHPEEHYTVVTRFRGAQQFTDVYTYTGSYITQVDHQESGMTEKYLYDLVSGGTSTLTMITMDPSASPPYYFKKISRYNENFDLTETVEGKVASEGNDPTGSVLISYDDANNPNFPTKITDQRESNINFTYNSTSGKVTQVSKSNENNPGVYYEVTNLQYNLTDWTIQQVTDPNNKVTAFTYYTNMELQTIDPPGVLPPVEYAYDDAGRVVTITSKDDVGNDRVTEIERDWLGRIRQIIYPEEGGVNLATTYDYNAPDLYDANASYGVNVIDTNGVKTQYLYNSGGLLWKVIKDRGDGQDDLNAVTTFEYDAYGNLVALTDPENHTTTFEYDSLDKLISVTYPTVDENERVKSFTYFPDGSLKTRTDQNVQTAAYEYDDDNRLWIITYRDTLGQLQDVVTYQYEPNGLISSLQNSAGTVAYQYDDINRLQSTNGALTGNVDQVSYQYYNGGQTHYMTSGVGQTSYGLNDWNAVQSVTSPYNRTIGYDYNEYTGNLYRITRPNNTYTNYDFDNLDRLESYMTHMPGGDYTYQYDYYDSNLISDITLPDNKRYEYVYDDLYRLTNEYALNSDSTPIYTNNFGYDLADNRTSQSNGSSDVFTLNALNQITAIYSLGQQPPHTTFTYDFNGNLKTQTTSAGTVSMEYDYENRLSKITYPVGGSTELVYDALGRRLKTVEKNGQGQVTGETHYAYDGLNMIAELTGTDTLAAFFTQGIGIDDPLIMRYAGADYFYQKNHQNSVTEVDNINGGAVKKYKYDAFGNIKQETGPTVNRGFTYTSRERHARSGLYYYRARWYSPTLGRFLTPDPIGYLGGMNLFAYVGNDPVNYIDPFGHEYNSYFDYNPAGQAVGSALRDIGGALTYVLEPVAVAADAIIESPLLYSPYLPGERDLLMYPEEFQGLMIRLVDGVLTVVTFGKDPTFSIVPSTIPSGDRCERQG